MLRSAAEWEFWQCSSAFAIPGVGPIVALGPMLTVLGAMGVGAAAGGLIGALHNMGISHEEAPLYEEAVRRGAVMVAALVDDRLEEEAVAALKRHGARWPVRSRNSVGFPLSQHAIAVHNPSVKCLALFVHARALRGFLGVAMACAGQTDLHVHIDPQRQIGLTPAALPGTLNIHCLIMLRGTVAPNFKR